MPTLLVVHHTVSPPLEALLHAAVDGATQPELVDVDVVVRPALVTSAIEVMEADAYLLGTPANLGYLSGAMKHFFDTIYYPCLDATQRRPWGIYVHGNNDVDGAVLAAERIVAGLQWRAVAAPVRVIGPPDEAATDACWELGAVLAASLLEGGS